MINPHDKIQEYADDYVHDLLTDSERATVIAHCAQCDSCQAELDKAINRWAAFLHVPEEKVSQRLIQKAVDGALVDSPPKTNYVERVIWASLALAALLFAIIHFSIMNLSPTPFDLVVIGQNQLFADTQGSIRVVLFDRSKNLPVPNERIDVELVNARTDARVHLASFVTDENGTGTPVFQLPDWEEDDYELKVTSQIGRTSQLISRVIRLQRDWKVMLSTDKPVYQPGQTIRVRSLTLRRPDLKPAAGQNVEFRIVDPKGNLILKQNTVTSRFGISAFECPLATELLHGLYTVECEIGNSTSSQTVDVKKYVLPKFKIDVNLDKPFFHPGDQISGSLDSNYFFGKPVAGGTVEIRTIAKTPGDQNESLASFVLDDNGTARFKFPVPMGIVGTRPNAGDAELELSFTVRDTADQQRESFVRCLITNNPIRIELVPESSKMVVGESNRVFVFTSYADGRPAKTRVSISDMPQELETNEFGVTSFEFTPKKITVSGDARVRYKGCDFTVSATDATGLRCNREISLPSQQLPSDFVVRLDKAVFNGGETVMLNFFGNGNQPVLVDILKEQQTLLTRSVMMQDGSGQLPIDLTPELHGTLQICAYRFNDDGIPIKKNRTFFVRRASGLTIHTEMDKPTYRPGDAMQIKLKIEDAKGNPSPGAVSLSIVDEAVYAVESNRPGLAQAFFELDQVLLKPVYQVYPWSPNFSINNERDRIEFEVAAFSRIGQDTVDRQSRLRHLVDNFLEGDASILEVLDRPDLDQLAENTWLPDGALEFLRSNDSLHSMIAKTYPADKLSFERWQAGAEETAAMLWWVFGVLVIFAIFNSLVIHSRFRVVEVVCFLFVIGILIGMMLPAVQQVREASRRGAAGSDLRQLGLALENQRTVIGEAGSIQEADGKAPRVREWFPETLLWRPELITDDHGEITIDVDLADSITSWRVLTSAVTVNGDLGASQAAIEVFQPFFVDVNLPIELTRGDEISLPIVVYNYLDQSQKVQVVLKESEWFELLEPDTKSIELNPNETRSEYFRIRAIRLGQHKLLVTATGDSGVADAIKKSIEIGPEGTPVTEVANGTIEGSFEMEFQIPKDAIEGTGKAVIKIYPSSFSQVVEGLDSIFQRPHGCFEQTSSTTYPSVLALDYLRKNNKNIPEVEAKALQYIHLGYQRLLTFEVSGGGFDWFGNPPANRVLTAYGLMEFKDMAAVCNVDPELIKRTENWLLSQQNSDGTWAPENHLLHDDPTGQGSRLATTAYIAWSVFESSTQTGSMNATREFLLSHSPESIKSPYVLALVCNALIAMDERTGALPYVRQLATQCNSSPDGKLIWWSTGTLDQTLFYGAGKASDVETTAMAALALLNSNSEPALTAGALRWLVAQKDPSGAWYSTQATVLALKALLQGTGESLGEEMDRNIVVKHNGRVIENLSIPANQSNVMQQVVIRDLQPNIEHLIRLEDSNHSNSGFQIAIEHYQTEDTTPSIEPISIELVYDREELTVADQLNVSAKITNQMESTAPMVMVTLPIPPGFELNRLDLEQLVDKKLIAKYEINPRSSILYFRSIDAGKSVAFDYRLTATMPLNVRIAPGQVYLYYDPQTKGQSQSANVVVIEK